MVEAREEDILARYRVDYNEAGKGVDKDALGRSLALQVLTEVINTRKSVLTSHDNGVSMPVVSKSPTPTEYYAACMSALDSASGKGGNFKERADFLFLLSVVLPKVPRAVLKRKSDESLKILLDLLKATSSISEHNLCVRYSRYCISCVAQILQIIEYSDTAWARPIILNSFHEILACLAHERPKVRKLAQHSVREILILAGQKGVKTPHRFVADVCLEVMTSCTVTDCTRTLQLLGFLKVTLPYMTHGQNKLIAKVLEIAAIGHTDLTLFSLMVIGNYFGTTDVTLDKKVIQESLKTLHEMSSSHLKLLSRDARLSETWSDSISNCLQRAANLKLDEMDNMLSLVIRAIVKVMCACTTGIALHPLSIKLPDIVETYVKTESQRQSIQTALEELALPQYQNYWCETFLVFVKFFESVKDVGTEGEGECLIPLLCKFISIRESIVHPITGADKTVNVPWKGNVEKIISAAVCVFGIKKFLLIVPLKGTGKKASNYGMSASRAWLLPVLKDSIGDSRSKLEYFRKEILKVAGECEKYGQELANTSKAAAKMQRTRGIQLWSLFPAFAKNCEDIADQEGFSALAPILAQALQDERYPELTHIVSLGMQALIDDVKEREDEMKILSSFARNFLPILFNNYNKYFLDGMSEQAQTTHDFIRTYSLITPSDVLNPLFKQLLKQLLLDMNKMDSKNSMQSRSLSSLSLALIPCLDTSNIDLLFRVVRPIVEEKEDSQLQKSGYKVLESICSHKSEWVFNKKDELILIMRTSLLSVSVSAKTSRLRCLSHVMESFQKESALIDCEEINKVVAEILGEVMLCTKESNKKARMAAFKVLIVIAETMENVYCKQDKKKGEGLESFILILVAGLAAETPHMRSAAVLSLSKAFTEYGSVQALQSTLVKVARATLLLLNERSREVAKSVIGFSKVCSVKLPKETTLLLLDDIISSLLPWAEDTKNRFSMKIRIVFERLVKRLGGAVEKSTKISKDHKILVYIRKQASYRKRKHQKHCESIGRENQILQSDNEKLREGRKRKRNNSSEFIMDERDGEIDLLDSSALGNIRMKIEDDEEFDSDDSAIEFSRDGRLVVNEDDEADTANRSEDSNDEAEPENFRAKKKPKVEKDKAAVRIPEQVTSIHGAEYRGKKAGGDVKKRGNKFEPYAYIKLNPKLLNKRRKHEAAKQFRGIGKNKQSKLEKKNRREKAGGRNRMRRFRR